MIVRFKNSFKKDIKHLDQKQKGIKSKLQAFILSAESANSIMDLHHIKKMKGTINAYRVRIGDYRVGLYYEDDTIILVRFIKRNDIYKLFP